MTMQGKYTKEQIGSLIAIKDVVSVLNNTNKGTFAFVSHYQDKKGNVSDFLIRTGVNYGSIKQSSISQLQKMVDSWVLKDGTFNVSFDTWLGPDNNGVIRAWALKGKKEDNRVEMSNNRSAIEWQGSVWDSRKKGHVSVISIAEELLYEIKNPRAATSNFESEATSLSSLDDRLYIRDCLVLNSKYHEQESLNAKRALEDAGINVHPSKTDEKGAAKKWLQSFLPYSRYRSFFFDTGVYAYISVGGATFLSNEHGDIFETLPEFAKEFAKELVKGNSMAIKDEEKESASCYPFVE